MKPILLAAAFFDAIERKDWAALERMLDEGFIYQGPLPDPVGKDVWMSFQKAVQAAFPDWDYHLSKLEVLNGSVRATVSITGTHTQELAIPWKGIKKLPPTGKKVTMPQEHALLKMQEGKIIGLKVEPSSHGSLPGLLSQLGLE